MSKWNCAICGKDLYEVMRKQRYCISYRPKSRRWVCDKCIDREEKQMKKFKVEIATDYLINNGGAETVENTLFRVTEVVEND